MRLDLYLTQSGLARSRTEAQHLIKGGYVCINGMPCHTPSTNVSEGTEVEVDRSECRYVSRGGLKLEAALKHFGVSPAGHIALDIGASTGGFTDCLLQFGAKRVYALENGHGQLAQALFESGNVVNMERFNAREMCASDFDARITFVTMDVSFISQTLILPAIAQVIQPGGVFVSLIKPQFEVGRQGVGRGGIVKDGKLRTQAVRDVCDFASRCGFALQGVMESPIKGGDGNVEYFGYFIREEKA